MKKTLQNGQIFERTFQTQDIQLTACLHAFGAHLLAIDRKDPNRCTFVLEDSPDLRRCVEAYWQRQLTVEPQALFGALKAVKNRLYNNV